MLRTRVRIVVTAPETNLGVPDCNTEPTTVFVLYVPDFATKEGNERFIDELCSLKCFAHITSSSPWDYDQTGTASVPCPCSSHESYQDTLAEIRPLAKKYARQPD